MPDDTATGLISDDMRGLLGKVQRRRTAYPIAASDIRKWAIAVYYPDPPPEEFMGTGMAAGEPPLTAPEEFNPFAWATPGPRVDESYIDPGFLEQRAGIAPPNVKFMVNGGTDCEYGVPMKEGDVITAEFSIRSYSEKQGKRGPLLIAETQDRWTNQRGELARNMISTLVRY